MSVHLSKYHIVGNHMSQLTLKRVYMVPAWLERLFIGVDKNIFGQVHFTCYLSF